MALETTALFTELHTARFWIDLVQIIGINILLSGDNAVVIALASRSLPDHQRRMAVLGGSAAAVVLRITLCLIIESLLQVRFLKLIGGLLLLYIGVNLLSDEENNDEIAAHSHMWGAIRTILIADAVMSLDNVVAIAAAAHDSVLLITLGLVISIPLIVYGSQLMLRVLQRFPILIVLGGGLLGWIAGEIILSDPLVATHLPIDETLAERLLKPALALLVMGVGTALARRQKHQTE
mgnify:FL=1